jgi:hypothetical protein
MSGRLFELEPTGNGEVRAVLVGGDRDLVAMGCQQDAERDDEKGDQEAPPSFDILRRAPCPSDPNRPKCNLVRGRVDAWGGNDLFGFGRSGALACPAVTPTVAREKATSRPGRGP